MKVLLVHNFYRSSAPSGEDEVYRSERSLLERRGIKVIPYERHNDELEGATFSRNIRIALGGVWSQKSYSELLALIRSAKPDVAHFHNTFPQISPSGWAACRDLGVPVVQTLHNFRYICPEALLTRDGRTCDECIGRMPFPALIHRCYRNSLPATFAQFLTIGRNRLTGAYQRLVDRYLVLTKFAEKHLIDGGLPGERITVKHNFIDNPPAVGPGGGGYAVYVGRLREEKGVMELLAGWRLVSGLRLKVVGDGRLRGEMEEYVRAYGLDVEFLGMRNRHEVHEIMGRAEMTLIPSICNEGLPMVLLESLACGTPVVTSRQGGLDEAVREGATGLKFSTGDVAALASAVELMRGDRKALQGMREAARAEFMEKYDSDAAFAKTLQVYREVTGSPHIG